MGAEKSNPKEKEEKKRKETRGRKGEKKRGKKKGGTATIGPGITNVRPTLRQWEQTGKVAVGEGGSSQGKKAGKRPEGAGASLFHQTDSINRDPNAPRL